MCIRDSIYNAATKAKALDALRSLLPASTLTNVGVTGNGRAFEYLLSIMFGSDLSEEKKLALQIKNELDTTIKSFVRRSNDKYGKMLQKYLNAIKKNSAKISKLYATGNTNKGSFVKLVSYEKESNAINNIITALIYEQSPSIEFAQIRNSVKKIPRAQKIKIINDFSNIRKNRRHRPPRAFELADYTFDLLTNYGMFRDFHRHRALTLERQLLTTDHGFDTPNEIIEPCSDLWRRMFVWWDGKINPCDVDYKSLLSVGKYPNKTLEQLWKSESYNTLRKKHLEKKRKCHATAG